MPGSPDRLRVLTINVWNRAGPWAERLALLRRGIEELSPDVVGLQEIMQLEAPGEVHKAHNQADEIAAGLGYETRFASATHVGAGLHLGNAVLSRWPITSHRVLQLPFFGDDETRGLLAVEIAAPFGALPFFVTHLNWKLHHTAIRQQQVLFIAERIAELAPPRDRDRFPPILAGDFNAEPLSDEIRFLAGWHAIDGKSVYFADCYRVSGGREEGGATFVPSRNAYAAATHEPDRRIDYVFVRGPDSRVRGKPLSCRVVLDESGGGVWPSDHFGVLAEISTGLGT